MIRDILSSLQRVPFLLLLVVGLAFSYISYNSSNVVQGGYDLAISESLTQSSIDDAYFKKQHDLSVAREKELLYKESIAPDIASFGRDGSAHLIRHVNTQKPVVFLTIDDGVVKNPQSVTYIKQHRLNPTLFLTDQYIRDDYSYFDGYLTAGISIQNHTITHPNLRTANYNTQKTEMCGQSDRLQARYGTRPTIFRPPYGEFNDDTFKAAHDCGMDFVVHWSATVDGGMMHYQTGNHLKPGDIVLMHFRPMMIEDLTAFNDEANSQGLTPAYLNDWLK